MKGSKVKIREQRGATMLEYVMLLCILAMLISPFAFVGKEANQMFAGVDFGGGSESTICIEDLIEIKPAGGF